MKKYEDSIYNFLIIFLILSTIFSIFMVNNFYFDLEKYSYFIIISGLISLILILF